MACERRPYNHEREHGVGVPIYNLRRAPMQPANQGGLFNRILSPALVGEVKMSMKQQKMFLHAEVGKPFIIPCETGITITE